MTAHSPDDHIGVTNNPDDAPESGSRNKTRVAVLASGTGSNFVALADAALTGQLGPAEIVLLLSNKQDAPVLERARERSIPTSVIDHRNYPTREQFDAEMVQQLKYHCTDLIVMAGFMRIVTAVLLKPYADRILNVHPSLLPAFIGADAIGDALNYGARCTGVTVHFVEEAVDSGPIIMQEPVRIRLSDTRDSLAARIHAVEHRILPIAVRAFAEGRISVSGRQVTLHAEADDQ